MGRLITVLSLLLITEVIPTNGATRHIQKTISQWNLTSGCDCGDEVTPSDGRLSQLSSWPSIALPPPTDCNPTYGNITSPTTVLAALDNSGVYGSESLYQNMNLVDKVDPSIFSCPWYFSTCISILPDSSDESDMVLLELEGINYRANISVNGIQVASSTEIVGSFRYFQIDLTDIPPIKQSLQMVDDSTFDDDPIPDYCISIEVTRSIDNYWTRNATDLAISVVDWSVDAPDGGMGIIQPISLHVDSGIRLRYPSAYVSSMDNEHIEITVIAQLENRQYATTPSTASSLQVDISLSLFGENGGVGSIITCSMLVEVEVEEHTNATLTNLEFNSSTCDALSLSINSDGNSSGINIDEVLWWPYQMGQPNMQQLNISVSQPPSSSSSSLIQTKHSGDPTSIYDAITTQVGLRYMVAGLDANGRRLFQVNNQNLLIQGGGYAQDLLLRSSPSRYFLELQHVMNMGLNMIRFEGKFPDESLFDLMDELGILALPGICCCDAWQNWDLWPTNNLVVSSNSIESQLLRLRRHPSMAGFLLSSDQLPPDNIEVLYRQAVSDARWFNPIIAAAAEGVSTLNNESTGVKMLGPYAWVPPSYWSDPQALAMYGGPVGFSTEISPGGSPLSVNSWLKTTGHDLSMAYCLDDGGVYSDVWNFHCGNQHGVFKSLKYFVPSLQLRYGGDFIANQVNGNNDHENKEWTKRGHASFHDAFFTTKTDEFSEEASQCSNAHHNSQVANKDSLTKFITFSHLTAYESHRAMFEAYSSNKYNATGVIQWMLNNGLPQHIWHLFDWFLNSGGAYYGTQRAHEPLHASFDAFNGDIKVINSLYQLIEENTFQLTIRVLSLLNGDALFEQFIPLPQLEADSVLLLPSTTLSLDQIYKFAKDYGGMCLLRLDIQLKQSESDFNVEESLLIGRDESGTIVLPKPNVYWISEQPDVVDWDQCNFYVCNITSGNNFTMLSDLLSPIKEALKVETISLNNCSSSSSKLSSNSLSLIYPGLVNSPRKSSSVVLPSAIPSTCVQVNITNLSPDYVAFFIRLEVLGVDGVEFTQFDDVEKVAYFDDNFITLLPLESRIVNVKVYKEYSDINSFPKVMAHAFNDL